MREDFTFGLFAMYKNGKEKGNMRIKIDVHSVTGPQVEGSFKHTKWRKNVLEC